MEISKYTTAENDVSEVKTVAAFINNYIFEIFVFGFVRKTKTLVKMNQ